MKISALPSLAFFLAALILCASCRTPPNLPPADFSAPGWHVRQGQGIWQPPGGRPPLAGDLLVATNDDGDFFAQMSKNPFPLVTAQRAGNLWRIEYGANDHKWAGIGNPPGIFLWLQLPSALGGADAGKPWLLTRLSPASWRFRNSRTGETLEGEFFP